MLSTAQVKTLVQYDWIYSAVEQNADLSPMRFKVTSVKTWKRRPNNFELRLTHGRYDHRVISSGNTRALACFCLTAREAIEQRELVRAQFGQYDTQERHEAYVKLQMQIGNLDTTSIDEVIMSGRQIDIHEAGIVGVLIDHTGKRFWACVNGANVLRVGNADRISIEDNRTKKGAKKPDSEKNATTIENAKALVASMRVGYSVEKLTHLYRMIEEA